MSRTQIIQTYKSAHSLYLNQRYEEALDVIDECLSFGPTRNSLLLKALTLCKLQSFREALSIFNTLCQQYPYDGDLWLNRARCCGDSKMFFLALESLNRCLDIDHSNLQAWRLKGVVLNELGKHHDALFCYQRVISFCSNDRVAWKFIGNTHALLKEYDSAVKAFDHCLSLESNQIDVLYNRAMALYRLDDFENTLKAVENIISLNKDHYQSNYLRAQLLVEHFNKCDEALEAFRYNLTLRKHDNRNIFGIGLCYYRKECYDKAIQYFKEYIDIVGDDHEALVYISSCYSQIKKLNDALGYIEKSLTIKDDYWHGWLTKGDILYQKGDYNSALISYLTCKQYNESCIDTLYKIGACCYHLRDYHLSLDYFLTYFDNIKDKNAENHWQALVYLGYTQYELGMFEKALNTFLQAIEIGDRYWGGVALVLSAMHRNDYATIYACLKCHTKDDPSQYLNTIGKYDAETKVIEHINSVPSKHF